MAYDGGYTGSEAEQALAWVSDATGIALSGELEDALRDGVALCELANRLQPKTVKRISKSSMPFPQRENVKAFIDAARQFGVPDRDNFDTSDLFEAKSIRQVLICLGSLGRAAYTIPGYTGPCLGRAAAAGAGGPPKHAVRSGGGLWGKSGGEYTGSKGGGVQVEASSRGTAPSSPSQSEAAATPALELMEGVPPESSMVGVLRKKAGVTSSWNEVEAKLQGDYLILQPTGSTTAPHSRLQLGEFFETRILDAARSEFEMLAPSSSLRFRAATPAEAQRWVSALSEAGVVAPSPLTRGKEETVAMWQLTILDEASVESYSVAIAPTAAKSELLTLVSQQVGRSVADVSISAMQRFFSAKFRSAGDSAQVCDFMTDDATIRVAQPAAPSMPSVRSTHHGKVYGGKADGKIVMYTFSRADVHFLSKSSPSAEGLDATLAKKMAGKYDPELEAEVRAWMGGLGVEVEGDDFTAALRSGVTLCELINAIKPGKVRINKRSMPFLMMENISSFLGAAVTMGVLPSEAFQTVDLFEAKNPAAVLRCVAALMRNNS